MKGKYHIILDIVFFVILWLVFSKIVFSMIFVSLIATYAPDADQNFEVLGHRSFWSHNSLIWLLFFAFNSNEFLLVISMSIGLHCLLDLRFTKQTGFYTIKILKIKTNVNSWYSKYRMNGKQTTAWLIINFLVPFLILIWWCLI